MIVTFTPFLKDSNPLESVFASSQNSTLVLALAAGRQSIGVPNVRGRSGVVFMRRVSLPGHRRNSTPRGGGAS